MLGRILHAAPSYLVDVTMTISFLAAAAAMAIFAFAMVQAALTDLLTRKIRNRLVLMCLATYAVLAPFAGFTAGEIAGSVIVALAVLLVALLLFAWGFIGGGDAKLAAVTSLWFGIDQTPSYFIWTALLGGAFAVAIILFRKLPLRGGIQNASWVAKLHSRGTAMPYGVAMAVAALLVFPATRWATVFFGV
jgi:prepilin peptidase CpaA